LLPLLKRNYQPALQKTVLRLMDILRAEAEFVSDATEEWLGSRAKSEIAFRKFPLAIQRRCIQAQLLRQGVPADFGLVERLRTSPGKPFNIVPQVTVECDASGRLHFHEAPRVKAKTDEIEIGLAGRGGETLFAGKKISWRVSRQRTFRRPQPQPGQERFDADKVGGRVVLRHWKPGDRFQPIGMLRGVKLQDLFTNGKIPRARRHDLIVATTVENEVFWVEGLRIAERFKLTPQTTRQITWQWKPGKTPGLRVSAHHVRLAQLKNV